MDPQNPEETKRTRTGDGRERIVRKTDEKGDGVGTKRAKFVENHPQYTTSRKSCLVD